MKSDCSINYAKQQVFRQGNSNVSSPASFSEKKFLFKDKAPGKYSSQVFEDLQSQSKLPRLSGTTYASQADLPNSDDNLVFSPIRSIFPPQRALLQKHHSYGDTLKGGEMMRRSGRRLEPIWQETVEEKNPVRQRRTSTFQILKNPQLQESQQKQDKKRQDICSLESIHLSDSDNESDTHNIFDTDALVQNEDNDKLVNFFELMKFRYETYEKDPAERQPISCNEIITMSSNLVKKHKRTWLKWFKGRRVIKWIDFRDFTTN